MLDINKLFAILQEFLARATSKRLAALFAFLIYAAFIVTKIFALTGLPGSEEIVVLGIFLLVLPAIVTALAIQAFTKVPGGDDLTPPAPVVLKQVSRQQQGPKKVVPKKAPTETKVQKVVVAPVKTPANP